MNKRALLIASVSSGAIMGICSNMPVIHLFNCLLFAWVWSSTIFGAWLYQRNSHTFPAITPSQGAVVGLLGGIIGVVVFGLIYFPYSALVFGLGTTETERAISTGFLGFTGIVYLGINAIAYPLFGALGGAIGGVLFQKSAVVQP